MAIRFTHTALIAGAAMLLLSCGNKPANNHGPIVLGDSTTIVTENDPDKLKDLVTDLQPVIPAAEEQEAKPQQPADTAKPQPTTTPTVAATTPTAQQKVQLQQKPQPMPNTPGLKAEFKEVTVMIPGLSVKQAGKADLEKANGAVYTLQSGEINGSALHVSGNVTKVSQRIQTAVIMKNDMGTLLLDDLSETTGWKQMNGNGTYKIAGLDRGSLPQPDADASDIRNAVAKAARQRRWSHKKLQALQSEIRHVRNANQKPFSLVLRSVMWKIDGKDANGKMFSKQIRVDVPL